ncbi:GWT1-domain-containing protein [Atractiella rhizophila]|nr:GWT1-domain-containing protein [Atractiella rhizophila]
MDGQAINYKSEKEEFVSNTNGGTVLSINLVCLTALTSYALWIAFSAQRRRARTDVTPSHGQRRSNDTEEATGWQAFFVEYTLLILPLIGALTSLSSLPITLNLSLVFLAIVLISSSASAYSSNPKSPSSRAPSLPGTPRSHHKRDSSSHFVVKTNDSSPESIGILMTPQSHLPHTSPTHASFRETKPPPSPLLPHELFRKPFITVYRAHMMIMTVLCILAVDFRIFPREFAKCETWGTSIMDLGVGSFVFSLGIISAIPRLRSRQTRPFLHSVQKSFLKSLPVLILGLLRVLAVKGVEYPEHVTEYGVHWNFFFTLGAIGVCGVCFDALSSKVDYVVLGLFTTALHQFSLQRWGLQEWALFAERTNIFSQNKEGITSFPGYLAIFLLGTSTGIYVLPPDPYFIYRSLGTKSLRQKPGKLASVLSGYSILWWAALAVVRYGLEIDVSRRLANVSYVLWITAFNVSFILCYLLVEIAVKSFLLDSEVKLRGTEETSLLVPNLFESINLHGLWVFLIANLLTGLVNLSIHTIHVNSFVATVVLVAYSAAVFAFSWWFKAFRERSRENFGGMSI